MISGGLGGIGRSTARWMVDRGARNLVLLSRSGPQNTNAAVLLRDLQAKGARVETPVCDVTNWDSISSVFAQIVQTMPPIKGCIQGSMVLKVILIHFLLSVQDPKDLITTYIGPYL